jgi:hypothetical protein
MGPVKIDTIDPASYTIAGGDGQPRRRPKQTSMEHLWQDRGQNERAVQMKSQSRARKRLAMAGRLSASVLIVLGFVSEAVLQSTHDLAQPVANSAGLSQSSERTPPAGNGIIAGVVVNERQEPVARAQVQAFSVRTTVPQAQQGQTVPFSMRGSGSASTDAEGRFQISGLESGDYLVAAETLLSLTSGESKQTPIYGTTFYPSTIDHQAAVHVPALAQGATAIQIELVRVKGARVSGSVVSRSGRSTSGMDVRLFHRFGGFGSESRAAVVGANGTFEIPRVPPGWYRVTVAPQAAASNDPGTELATRLIEVQDADIADLSLVVSTGASITGRVVAGPGAGISSPTGLRVSASPSAEQYSPSRAILATVASDSSFRMTGLSGTYQLTASAGRPPFVKATRITVDGIETPPDAGVELTEGSHEVVVFLGLREPPAPSVDETLSSAALVAQFKREEVWRQFTIAKEIADRHDSSVLPSLVAWLSHEDRHVRGNVAFIFGRLGDPRGFQVITDILTDRSDRPRGVIVGGNWTLQAQIREDRYYAAHLLGDLRDSRAIPVLVPLLKDMEINSIVPWALGQIGDKRAIGPLLDVLDDDSPSMRVLSIYALETLNAREALPRLLSLLDDNRTSNFGAAVSVADAARAAIAKLR